MKHGVIKGVRLAAFAALMSTTGIAHANWTGTWETTYGDLRFVQEGERVYGDYANRGYFEGRVSEDGNRLRGTFQYTGQRSRNGYIEFIRSGDRFDGGWTWAKDGPASYTLSNWSGELTSTDFPELTFAIERDDYWADFWKTVGDRAIRWAFEGVSQSEPAYGDGDPAFGLSGDEWNGTFNTNYGEIRLIQDGRRVYGEYAKRGYFESCVHDGGTKMRGTFQYFKPRTSHGFIEFRTDGDGFRGSWTWTRNGVPAANAKVNWSGARISPDVRGEVYIRANEISFADMWSDITDAQRRWVLGSDYYDSCDPPEVDYEGSDWGDDWGNGPADSGEDQFPGEMLDPSEQ